MHAWEGVEVEGEGFLGLRTLFLFEPHPQITLELLKQYPHVYFRHTWTNLDMVHAAIQAGISHLTVERYAPELRQLPSTIAQAVRLLLIYNTECTLEDIGALKPDDVLRIDFGSYLNVNVLQRHLIFARPDDYVGDKEVVA